MHFFVISSLRKSLFHNLIVLLLLNDRVMEVSTSGIFDYINSKEILRFAGRCENLQCLMNIHPNNFNADHDKPIELNSFLSLFMTCFIMIIISFITLLLEILLSNHSITKYFISKVNIKIFMK
jgi:hypothetical protein